MPQPISPIDETSYTDAPAFDAEELLLNRPRPRRSIPVPSLTQDEPELAAPVQQPSVNVFDMASEPQAAAEPTPAAPATPHKQRKSGAWSRLMRMISDSRMVRFLGLVFVVAACYALVVTISFFAHIGSDQSAVISDDLDPAVISNSGGPLGAWLSNILINDWLGIGSFLLITWLALTGLKLLKVYKADFWGMTLRCLLTAVSLSIILGFITFELASPFYWGGMHGHLLSEKLVTFTGIWGALGVCVIMGGLCIFLYLTELSKGIRFVWGGLSDAIERWVERREQRREQARLQREQEEAEDARIEAEKMAAAQPAPQAEVPTAEAPTESKVDAPIAPIAPISPISPIAPIEPEAADSFQDVPLFVKTPSVEEVAPEPAVEEEDEEEPMAPLFADTKEGRREAALNQPPYDPRAELSNFEFPSIELLSEDRNSGPSVDATELEENKNNITRTLNNYGISIRRIEATVGPTVTLYEIIPAEGVRISKIKGLEDDIALSLSALGIRIIAPIPGKGTIGIEVPNKDPKTVSMRTIIESDTYRNSKMDLPMAMGRTISNEVFMADLCKMPHLLVAGATGMGKSVGLNAIIASLLYKKHPAELKFVLIDPKMVEFSLYAKLERHYLAKLPDEEDAIITDPSKVVATLNSLCVEMDNRYALLKDAEFRTVKEYNDAFVHHRLNPEKGHRYLPYIVVVVDEFADLIMTAGKEVETPIARIAQKARAVGIHMILATQRPSTNVITGLIKANFPGRVAFRVFQMVDSRTILDRPGANQLIGRGDMLFSNNGKLDRVQCAFIDTPEVSAICAAIDRQVGYPHAYELPEYVPESDGSASVANLGDRDPLFDECARLVVTSDSASTSSLQRRYSIGYNRAGKIMDQMEAAGIVGPAQGGKPRQVLVDPLTLERILENN